MILDLSGYAFLPLSKLEYLTQLERTFAVMAAEGYLLKLKNDLDDTSKEIIFPVHQRGYLLKDIENEYSRTKSEHGNWWKDILDLKQSDFKNRSCGTLYYVAENADIEIGIFYDDWIFSPWGKKKKCSNSVHFTIEISPNLFEENIKKWVLGLCAIFFNSMLFEYGTCCSMDERDNKNIDRSDGGMKAVGLDLSRYLPGFYWGNYYGEKFCREFTGVSKPLFGYSHTKLNGGIFVFSKLPPHEWNTNEYRKNESSAISKIGKQLFFNKEPGTSFGVNLECVWCKPRPK